MGIDEVKFLALQDLGRVEMPDFVSSDENDVRTINNQYNFIVSLVLQSYNWSFCTFKTKLDDPEELLVPFGRFKYKYTMPAKCLYIKGWYSDEKMEHEIHDYEQQGISIYSNSPEMWLDYTKKVSESEMPAYFIDLLRYTLSSKLCPILTGDNNLYQLLEMNRARAFEVAKNTDFRQSKVKHINLNNILEERA